jgi:hypothetical protein
MCAATDAIQCPAQRRLGLKTPSLIGIEYNGAIEGIFGWESLNGCHQVTQEGAWPLATRCRQKAAAQRQGAANSL